MPKSLPYDENDVGLMVEMRMAGMSTKEIADHFGCLPGSVWSRLKKRGLNLREMPRPVHRRIHSHGYVMVNGQYEHRLVMERELGRPLLPTEVVHHKNGVRSDNRPENLEVMASAHEHMRHHDHKVWTPEREAELLRLRRMGRSATQIAAELGCTVTSVQNRVHRLISRGTIAKIKTGAKRLTHCKQGHPMVEGNLYHYRNGDRGCRTCALDNLHRQRAKNRAERYDRERSVG